MPAADVLITPVWVWTSPVGTARPYEEVPYGANWPGWKRLGYTDKPLTVNLEREIQKKMVEQAMSKIGSKVTGETLTLETSLAEFTLSNLQLLWPGILTITPASAGVPGTEKLVGGNAVCLSTIQWGFEGLYQNEDCSVNLPLRFYCIGEAEMGGQLEFGKATQTGIPLKVEGSFDFGGTHGGTLYEWFKWVAPAQ
jgi:hypothetical protein